MDSEASDNQTSASEVKPGNNVIACPVCGAATVQEKCKVICKSDICRGRVVYNCAEFLGGGGAFWGGRRGLPRGKGGGNTQGGGACPKKKRYAPKWRRRATSGGAGGAGRGRRSLSRGGLIQATPLQERRHIGIAAGEVAEQLHGIVAAAARKQGLTEVIAVLALEAACPATPTPASTRWRCTPAPRPDPATGARAVPIYLTTSFVFESQRPRGVAVQHGARRPRLFAHLQPDLRGARGAHRGAGRRRRRDRDRQRPGGAAPGDRHADGRGLAHRRLHRALRRLAQPAALHAGALRHRDHVRQAARHRRLARARSGRTRGCCSAKRWATRASTCSTFRRYRRSPTTRACRCWSIRPSRRPG